MKLTPNAERDYQLQNYGKRPEIQGVVTHELKRFNDDGGAMTELLRLAAPPPGLADFRPAQINYSSLEPGVIKAFHIHRRQTDLWFVPPEDRVLLVLADMRADSPTEGARVRRMLGDKVPALVQIPPGVAHGCRNLGRHTARIVYFTDVLFSADPAESDEGRLPWDLLGPEIWEVSRE